MFSGDLVEYKSACYCGDAHFADWPKTLDKLQAYNPKALVPGRGDALISPKLSATPSMARAHFSPPSSKPPMSRRRAAARLKDALALTRKAMDGPFGNYAIYEHCLPFNVSRAYDEARGIDWPTIWTDVRDKEMWAALQA